MDDNNDRQLMHERILDLMNIKGELCAEDLVMLLSSTKQSVHNKLSYLRKIGCITLARKQWHLHQYKHFYRATGKPFVRPPVPEKNPQPIQDPPKVYDASALVSAWGMRLPDQADAQSVVIRRQIQDE